MGNENNKHENCTRFIQSEEQLRGINFQFVFGRANFQLILYETNFRLKFHKIGFLRSCSCKQSRR